jgi:predicted HAD superfamily Cof-like phosphohydrolase
MTMYDEVGAFHKKFDLPHYGDGESPHLLALGVVDFRQKFMQEELNEFVTAVAEGNLHDAADALADLCYVALGTAHMMGLPFDEIWSEVHRANMTKLRAASADDPASTRKHRMDVIKPPGFKPPDHYLAIERARLAAHD